MKRNSLPCRDGFFMPAEFSPHHGCLMIWPHRPGSWPFGAKKAREAFTKLAQAIALTEKVYMLAEPELAEGARLALGPSIEVIPLESNDAWARDTGPTFVVDGKGGLRGVNWRFNAWGGSVDGLYSHWEKDDALAPAFCQKLGLDWYDAAPFVLEGGSIHTDGEGTLLTTESCLLSRGRNPDLSREEIEEKLREYLGIQKVLWLPRGIYNDETNEHVDNVCAFVRPGEVVLAWTDDESDPQYPLSCQCLEYLERVTDARGRHLKVHKLPIPQKPQVVAPQELEGYDFEEGEDMREAGERLAASYVNFYLSNGHVLVPQFGDAHDALALEILGRLFAPRIALPIPSREILLGGGNIHCVTQQIPEGGTLR